MNSQDQKILDLLMAGWFPDAIEHSLELQEGVVRERLNGIAEERGLKRADKFHLHVRVVYLEAKRRGLLKGWPGKVQGDE